MASFTGMFFFSFRLLSSISSLFLFSGVNSFHFLCTGKFFLTLLYICGEKHKNRMVTNWLIKPLTPKNDWHLISPYNITPKSNTKVTRIKENDHQLKTLLIVKQILLVSTLVNVQRSVWRICILMFGCKGLMQQKCHSSATRYLGVSTNFSTNMLSSLKDFKDSLLADSRASSKSSGFITILIP